MSKTVKKTIHAVSESVASVSLARMRELVRERWRMHHGWFVVNVVLVLGSPFLGFMGLVGWWA